MIRWRSGNEQGLIFALRFQNEGGGGEWGEEDKFRIADVASLLWQSSAKSGGEEEDLGYKNPYGRVGSAVGAGNTCKAAGCTPMLQ